MRILVAVAGLVVLLVVLDWITRVFRTIWRQR